MEIQGDFIVGIFNYCDRWCERCPLTSRCGVFAGLAEEEFERDHGPLTEPRHERVARSLGAVAAELDLTLDDIEETAREFKLPEIAAEHREIEERASDHGCAVYAWLTDRPPALQAEAAEHLEVIGRYGFLVGSKIHRALFGIADGDGRLDRRSDANGSAKVALLALERLQAAWNGLVMLGHVPPREAEPFLTDLAWLVQELDRVLPLARGFVRPGFDEPGEVTRLNAAP